MPLFTIRFLPVIAAAAVLGLTSCDKEENILPASENTADTQSRHTAKAGSIPGRYLVGFKTGTDYSAKSAENILSPFPEIARKAQLIQGKVFSGFVADLSPAEVTQLRRNKAVAFVEPDQIVQLILDDQQAQRGANPNLVQLTDPNQPSPVYTIQPDTNQTISWGAGRVGVGRGIIAGRKAWVVDSGIQLDHPDLDVDLALSHSFLSTTTSPADEFGHGTQVAGILGARNNGYGVVGVAAGARLVSLRVMNASGSGTVSSAIAALNYIALHGSPGDVACLSLGANPSLALDNAVIALANLGIFITVAAGNSGADAATISPARVNHTNVFTVSGLRPDGTFMGISNWGSPVDYCAPGTALQTTKINSSYGSAGGTSMAAPHVAGILLVRGSIATDGYVLNDPDGNADPIPHL